jgi:hypothetical protein
MSLHNVALPPIQPPSQASPLSLKRKPRIQFIRLFGKTKDFQPEEELLLSAMQKS